MITKVGRSLHVQVEDNSEEVEVNVPIEMALEVIGPDGTISPSRAIGALRHARLSKLVKGHFHPDGRLALLRLPFFLCDDGQLDSADRWSVLSLQFRHRHKVQAVRGSCEVSRHDGDTGRYPLAVKVSDQQMAAVKIYPAEFLGEWNYTIKPLSAPTQPNPCVNEKDLLE